MVPALSYHIYENGAIGCYYREHPKVCVNLQTDVR